MKYVVLSLVMLLCSLHLVSANVYITEVMHSPTQTASDSDGEWLELYNAGSETVDLSNWTIDGNNFDDVEISPDQYLVVARELLDGTDSDTESFESYWGDNNGVWDEAFVAVDGSFTLSAEDTITLSNGEYEDIVSYNDSVGGENGRSIERLTLDLWQEAEIDGSPGTGSFSVEEEEGSEETTSNGTLPIYITVENSVPEIVAITFFSDDSSADGVQIMPNVGLEKEVFFNVTVEDSNGFEDVVSIYSEVNNQSVNLSFVANDSESSATFEGSFVMQSYDLSGVYNLTVFAADASSIVNESVSFAYLGIISSEINVTELSFLSEAGESSFESVSIHNSGNVVIDTEVYAEDFVSETSSIPADALSIFSEEWLPLDTLQSIELGLQPEEDAQLSFQLSLPQQAVSGDYLGSVVIRSVEQV